MLYPFGILYGVINAIRNALFDFRILKSQRFPFESIGVGNLSMGGTGKSVVVMYLIKTLREDFRIVILSRGYGRKTKGLIVAESNDNASTLGDEPFQFLERYPDTVVVVSEKRTLGMKVIQDMVESPKRVILDDVMQHRWVQPEMMIMTTSFENPYFKDFVFPSGGLREFRSGTKRADLLLITRSPEDLTYHQKEQYLKKIDVNIPVFFTKIRYADILMQNFKTIDLNELKNDFLLVTGIADSHHFVAHLKKQYGTFDHLKFKDHHPYSKSDCLMIQKRAGDKIILTTEKDYAKLFQNLRNERLYCLKIELDFVFHEEQNIFDKMVKAI